MSVVDKRAFPWRWDRQTLRIRFVQWERVCDDIISCSGQSSWRGSTPTGRLLPAGRQWPIGQRGNGQVTSFFLLPGMSSAGGLAGRMARCQKQPFRRVKKQTQQGEAAHRVWQRQERGHSTDRLSNTHMTTKHPYLRHWRDDKLLKSLSDKETN